MRFSWRGILLAGSICLVAAQSARAADRLEEFNKARRSIAQQLHNKEPGIRIEALARLEKFPLADSVKLVCNSLADADAGVQEAALTSLLNMNGSQEVCDTLLQMAKKSLGRKGEGAGAAPLLAVLLSSNQTSVEREVNEFFEKMTDSKNGVELAIMLADELGKHRKPLDVPPLSRLTKTKIFANHFGFRRAVVQALTQIPSREAVGALIEIMPRVEGEAQADAVEHLAQVTGQIFGMETGAWQRWWVDTMNTYEYPTHAGRAPYRSVAINGAGQYYGLPLFAERLVFVLDTSGSMAGPRIVAAKRELVRAIGSLPDHAHFSVVVFNGVVDVWQKRLVPATSQWKNSAIHYVNAQGTQLNTFSYDALETAFTFDTEAIYFLSDGAPHGGKITAPVDIVAAITAANRTRRISLYTIGIGAGFPGGPLDTFLKTLAEQNLGLYRRIDG